MSRPLSKSSDVFRLLKYVRARNITHMFKLRSTLTLGCWYRLWLTLTQRFDVDKLTFTFILTFTLTLRIRDL